MDSFRTNNAVLLLSHCHFVVFFHHHVRNVPCNFHVDQYQALKVPERIMVEIDPVVFSEPHKIFQDALPWPVLLLHVEAFLELCDCDIGGGAKAHVGANGSAHQKLCPGLEMFPEPYRVGLGEFPTVAVEAAAWDQDLDRCGIWAWPVHKFVLAVPARLFQHPAEHFVLPGMVAEIDGAAIIVFDEALDVGLDRYGNSKIHRILGS